MASLCCWLLVSHADVDGEVVVTEVTEGSAAAEAEVSRGAGLSIRWLKSALDAVVVCCRQQTPLNTCALLVLLPATPLCRAVFVPLPAVPSG